MKNQRVIYLTGFLFFFGISWLLYHAVPPFKSHIDVDSSAYVNAAQLYTQDGSFKRLRTVPYYALGYAYFLSAIERIWGRWSVTPIVVVQVCLMMGVIALLSYVGYMLWGKIGALIAYILGITNIGFIVFPQFILTETLLVWFLTLYIAAFILFITTKQLRWVLGAGFCLGLSCLVKPAGLYAVILLLPILLFSLCSLKKIRLQLLPFLLFLIPFGSPLLLNKIHNYMTFGDAQLGNLLHVNLYYWFYPHMRAYLNHTTSDHERTILQRTCNQAEIAQMLITDVKEHPILALYTWGKNIIKTWCGLFTVHVKLLVDEQFTSGCISFFRITGSFIDRCYQYVTAYTSYTWIKVLGWLEIIINLIKYVCIIVGLPLLWRRHGWQLAYFFISYVLYFSFITEHDGCARFRMMLEPVFIIMSTAGAMSIINWYFQRIKRIGNEST